MTWIRKTGSSFSPENTRLSRGIPLLRGRCQLSDSRDKRAGCSSQRAVAPVGDRQFPPEFFLLRRDQADAAGQYLVAREAGADQRDAEAGCDEALDHPHAWQFHGNLQLRLVGTKKLVHEAAGVAGFWEEDGLFRDLGQRD